MGVAIADAPRKNSANRSEDHLFVRAANTHCIVGTPFVQSDSVWAWHLPQTEGSARDGKNVGRGRGSTGFIEPIQYTHLAMWCKEHSERECARSGSSPYVIGATFGMLLRSLMPSRHHWVS